MKKPARVFPMLLIPLVLMCACSPAQNGASGKPLNEYLVTNSIALTLTMDSLAQSTEYITELVSGSPEITGLVADIASYGYASPAKAALIKVPDTALDAMITAAVGQFDLPGDAYEVVKEKTLAAVPSVINSRSGAATVAAASVLTAGKVFRQHEELTANTYVILVYDGYCSATLFRKATEGVTSASSTFLFPHDELNNALTEETAAEYLSEAFGVSGVGVEYVAGDTIAGYR